MTVLLCAIFFASGSAALIFETLWFRQAGLGFGNSVWASSLVLSGFMAGLALGNALAARYGSRFRNPIRVYALAEATIAVTGVGLVFLFPTLGASLAPWLRPLLDHPLILNSLRLLLAFLLLLVPSTAMGVTLPLLTRALMAEDPNFGSVLGKLYGWNTLGAVNGVILGETYLIGALGVQGTALAAGGLNVAAAALAGWLSTRYSLASIPPAKTGRPAIRGTAARWWLSAAFLTGFCMLALEVVWFRFLLLFINGRSTAFALMLGVVLVGIALGGLVASLWLRLSTDAHRFASPVAFAGGLLCVATYATFPVIIHPFTASTSMISEAIGILRVGFPLMFPVSFLSGIFFTLVGAALRGSLDSETETTGILTLANTIGAALGSLVGGFVLLPGLGMEKSFFVIAMLYGGVGALLLRMRPAALRAAFTTAALLVLAAAFFPFGSMNKRLIQIPVDHYLRRTGTVGRVEAVREGLTETIMYLEIPMLGRPISHTMLTNSFAMAGTDYEARRYMKLYVYWAEAVHPDLKRALLICYGVGNTAKAMTDSKSLESIDVVDISRDVLEMNDVVYPNEADRPLRDPRVRVHIEDGRYYLRTTDQRFDLITAEPPPPQNAGVVNLYTREYFRLLYDRLADGGIVAYWLPLHLLTDVSTRSILRAFCDVFDDCSLWHGMGPTLMMIGIRNPQRPVSEEHFTRQWNDPVVGAEMRDLGFERPEQLGALFIGDADYLNRLTAGVPALVDNYPKRIEAPLSSQKEAGRLFASINDTAAERERFRRSPLIRRLWPEPLRVASLPYFDLQKMINDRCYDTSIRPHPDIEKAHVVLTQSPLNTLALWLLGGNADIERVAAQLERQDPANPVLQYNRGLRLLSRREYAAAVEPLRRAEQLPRIGEDAFRLRIYALCMSGQVLEAQRVAHVRMLQHLRAKGLTIGAARNARMQPFWVWMKQAFGIDPLSDA